MRLEISVFHSCRPPKLCLVWGNGSSSSLDLVHVQIPLGSPKVPRHRATVGSYRGGGSYERATLVPDFTFPQMHVEGRVSGFERLEERHAWQVPDPRLRPGDHFAGTLSFSSLASNLAQSDQPLITRITQNEFTDKFQKVNSPQRSSTYCSNL